MNTPISCTSSRPDYSPSTQCDRDRTGKADRGDNEICEAIIRLLFDARASDHNIQCKSNDIGSTQRCRVCE